MERVLVTYASKMGGTRGIAEMVAARLRELGLDTDLIDASEVRSLEGYRAVVLGSALYAGRWRRPAVRLLGRIVRMADPPKVWAFHSGPIGDEQASEPQPVPPRVREMLEGIGAPSVVTFGGRLADDAGGFLARAMVRNGRAGDWREPATIAVWAEQVATELASGPTR